MKIYKPKKSRQRGRDSLGRRNRTILYVMNYREVEPLVNRTVFEKIQKAWNKTKTPVTGFVNYRNVAEELKMPVGKLMMYLKGWHQTNPYAIGFNVDRMGSNVYFKIYLNRDGTERITNN